MAPGVEQAKFKKTWADYIFFFLLFLQRFFYNRISWSHHEELCKYASFDLVVRIISCQVLSRKKKDQTPLTAKNKKVQIII